MLSAESAAESVETISYQFEETNEASVSNKLTKSCSFDFSQIIMREQQIIKDYDRFKRVTEQLRIMLSANREMFNNPKNQIEIKVIKELNKRWNCEVGRIYTQRMMERYNPRLTRDELLASIQRRRWCFICCNLATILDDEGTFFCSIECQLNYYDA